MTSHLTHHRACEEIVPEIEDKEEEFASGEMLRKLCHGEGWSATESDADESASFSWTDLDMACTSFSGISVCTQGSAPGCFKESASVRSHDSPKTESGFSTMSTCSMPALPSSAPTALLAQSAADKDSREAFHLNRLMQHLEKKTNKARIVHIGFVPPSMDATQKSSSSEGRSILSRQPGCSDTLEKGAAELPSAQPLQNRATRESSLAASASYPSGGALPEDVASAADSSLMKCPSGSEQSSTCEGRSAGKKGKKAMEGKIKSTGWLSVLSRSKQQR